MNKILKKNTKPVCRITKGGEFNSKYTSKVEIVLTDKYETKSVTWNFHEDYLQGNRRYDMILGINIFYKLNIDLCFSDNTSRGNGGTYEEGTAPMKGVSEIGFNSLSYWIKNKIFCKK